MSICKMPMFGIISGLPVTRLLGLKRSPLIRHLKHPQIHTSSQHANSPGPATPPPPPDGAKETASSSIESDPVRLSGSLSTKREGQKFKKIPSSFSHVTLNDTRSILDVKDYEDLPILRLEQIRLTDSLVEHTLDGVEHAIDCYGTLDLQTTRCGRSHFLMALLHPIQAEFRACVFDEPDSIVKGTIATGTRIQVDHHFKGFFGLTSLVTKVGPGLGRDSTAILDAVGQLVVECEACGHHNVDSHIDAPVYGLLMDAEHFEFSCWDGAVEPPTFIRILPVFSPTESLDRLRLDTSSRKNLRRSLVPILETAYTIFFLSYSRSLDLALQWSRVFNPVDSPAWIAAKQLAFEAAKEGNEATRLSHRGDYAAAAVQADSSMSKLRESIQLVPGDREARLGLVFSRWPGPK